MFSNTLSKRVIIRIAMPAVTLLVGALSMTAAAHGCHGERNMPTAMKGVIDLHTWDFDRNGPADLSGEWGFFWKKLVREGELKNAMMPDACIQVPGIWNGRVENGRQVRGDGYATYRLRVLLPAGCEATGTRDLALELHDMGTAYTLFINGVESGRGGIVGTSAASAVPGFRPAIIGCAPAGNKVDIALQISNFHHRKGGAWEKVVLGPAEVLRGMRDKRLARDFILFGAIIIMGLYHLVLFGMRKTDRSFLFFGLFCLLIAVRIMVTGEYYIVSLFPGLAWRWIISAEYLTFYAGVPAFFLFLGSLFPEEFSRRALVATTAVGVCFCVFVAAVPARLYTHSLQCFQALSVGICLYGLVVLVRASLRDREGAVPFVAGFVILFAAVINDFLHNNMIIQSAYAVPIGLFLFIFSQSFFLSRRYARTMMAVERLTWEHDEAKYTLLQKRMGPHFLFNALNTVHALIRRDPERADRAVIMLADNYRFLIDHSVLPLVPFDTEWRFVENYLEIERLRFGDTVFTVMERRGDFSSVLIPPVTIQPLVENALKHGMRNRDGRGAVTISAESQGGVISISVKDNGPGVSPPCDVVSRSLGNIRGRLAHHFREVTLDVENVSEGGLLVRLSFLHAASRPAAAERVAERMYGFR
ncbi:MAG: histidine kinase [Spirochaetes bacterium]|nr:histidine kinase [Spirochaetota bacterium]